MTTIVEKAIDALRSLPEDRQRELAEIVIAEAEEPEQLTPAEQAAVDEGLAQAKAGEFATEEEVEAAFARLRSA